MELLDLPHQFNRSERLIPDKPLLFTRVSAGSFKLELGTGAQKGQWQLKSKAIGGQFAMTGSGRKWGGLLTRQAALMIPSVSVKSSRTGASTKANELGMRAMQERAYEKRGEQYLLIKSPPASGKSRALMFIALDKLHNQGLKQAIIVVPERSIGGELRRRAADASTASGPTGRSSRSGTSATRRAPTIGGQGQGGRRVSRERRQGAGLHARDLPLRGRRARRRGVRRSPDRGRRVPPRLAPIQTTSSARSSAQFIARDKAHIVAMTGSYFRGDAVPVLSPEDEAKFETVTYTYYEQLNGYEYLKSLDIGYYFYSGPYARRRS